MIELKLKGMNAYGHIKQVFEDDFLLGTVRRCKGWKFKAHSRTTKLRKVFERQRDAIIFLREQAA